MYRRTQLDNGIRVVTETMPNMRSLTMGIIIEASPHQDPTDRAGLAHMIEHLIFQGTSSRDSTQIAQMMDAGGGHMGGFTARDYTCYFSTVLDEYYPYALDLLGDILLNSLFLEDDLGREKEAILREIAAGYDSPEERVHKLLKGSAWATHSLGQPIAGEPDSVKRFSREDVIYFMHQHYTPDRIIVAAAGHVDHDDFTAQVRDALWRMLGNSESTASVTPEWKTAVSYNPMPVSQAYFSIGLPAYPYTHDDRYSLHILNNLLGGGISSRLYRRLREERGLVYNIGSEYHAYHDGGMLVIEGATAPEYLLSVLGLTMVELGILFSNSDPVDPEELWKSKMQIRGQHLIGGEDSNTRMSRLATQELYFGRYIPADEVLSQIEAVNLDAIAQTSVTLLDSLSLATVAVVGPKSPHYNQGAIESLFAEFR